MSLADFFDTRIRVWRPTEVLGSLGDQRWTYTPVGPVSALPNAVVNRPVAPLGDTGPGIGAIGRRRLYMEASEDVLERDVLEFVSGPDAPATYEVDNPPTRPERDHLQLDCRVWLGQLPAEAVS